MFETTRIIFEMAQSVLLRWLNFSRRAALIRSIDIDESKVGLYFRSLKRIAWVVVLGPIPIFVIGIIGHWTWLCSIATVMWMVATLLLHVIATPLAWFLSFLISGSTDTDQTIGNRYVAALKYVVLGEALLALFVTFVPISNYPTLLPIFLIVMIVLGITAKIKGGDPQFITWVYRIAWVLAAVLILGFFFPNTFDNVGERAKEIDPSTAEQVQTLNFGYVLWGIGLLALAMCVPKLKAWGFPTRIVWAFIVYMVLYGWYGEFTSNQADRASAPKATSAPVAKATPENQTSTTQSELEIFLTEFHSARARGEVYNATGRLGSSRQWLRKLQSGDEFRTLADETPRRLSIPSGVYLHIDAEGEVDMNGEGASWKTANNPNDHHDTSFVVFSSKKPCWINWRKK